MKFYERRILPAILTITLGMLPAAALLGGCGRNDAGKQKQTEVQEQTAAQEAVQEQAGGLEQAAEPEQTMVQNQSGGSEQAAEPEQTMMQNQAGGPGSTEEQMQTAGKDENGNQETDRVVDTGSLDGLYYTEYEDYIWVTSYHGGKAELVIPAEINGKPVVKAGDGTSYCFSDASAIVFPDTVTELYDQTFNRSWYVESVTLPEKMKEIPDGFFEECHALKSVVLPQGLEKIGEAAFLNCGSLQEINIPDSVTSIGADAFVNTAWLALQTEEFVIVGDGILIGYNGEGESVEIPDNVSAIACSFRENENLRSITVGDQVKKLQSGCFENCWGLEKVVLGNSITEIPENALQGSGIVQITLPEGLKRIGEEAFYECYQLEEVSIPDGVTWIGKDAFAETPWLENQQDEFVIAGDGILLKYQGKESDVTIPNGVRMVGASAFKENGTVRNIVCPDGVEEIGREAFRKCGSLESVTFADTVHVIEEGAFQQCQSLKTLTFPDAVEVIVPDVFNESGSLSDVTLPAREELTVYVESLYKLGDEEDVYRLHIPEAVKKIHMIAADILNWDRPEEGQRLNSRTNQKSQIIVCGVPGSYAEEFAAAWGAKFVGKEEIQGDYRYQVLEDGTAEITGYLGSSTVLEIPDNLGGSSVTGIGDFAFAGSSTVTEVHIPEGVTEIGNNAFINCKELVSISIPQSVVQIGDFAFMYCSALESVTLPEGLTEIEMCTFCACSNLKEVYIPKSVAAIGRDAIPKKCMVLVDGDSYAARYAAEQGLAYGPKR